MNRFCDDNHELHNIAVFTAIPKQKFNVPGWNTYGREKHYFACEAYLS